MRRLAVGAALVASGQAAQVQAAPESSLDAVKATGEYQRSVGKWLK